MFLVSPGKGILGHVRVHGSLRRSRRLVVGAGRTVSAVHLCCGTLRRSLLYAMGSESISPPQFGMGRVFLRRGRGMGAFGLSPSVTRPSVDGKCTGVDRPGIGFQSSCVLCGCPVRSRLCGVSLGAKSKGVCGTSDSCASGGTRGYGSGASCAR